MNNKNNDNKKNGNDIVDGRIDNRATAATLLARLEAQPLSASDDPLGFESRLAADNDWTLGHAARVAQEYRRFLVLTQVAGEAVSPSHDVDEAWHLHITRTADYARLCRDALGGFLHHQPAGIAVGEAERHRGMYAATLAHYERAFGHAAPADVWPRTAPQAAPPTAAIRLPGPFANRLFLLLSILGVVVGLAWASNAFGVFDAMHAVPGPVFLHVAFVVTVALAVLGWLSTGPFAPASPRDTLDPYEAAWLAGGPARMTAMAIGLLVERGELALRAVTVGRRERTGLVVTRYSSKRLAAPLHPVEAACLERASGDVLTYERALVGVEPWAARMRAGLQAAGLASDAARIALARAAMAAATAAWLVLTFERIAHALVAPRPVAGLCLLTVLVLATLIGLVVGTGRATWRGRAALRALGAPLRKRREASAERARKLRGSDTTVGIDPVDLRLTLALLGPAVVAAQARFDGLATAIGSHGMRSAGLRGSTNGACSGSGCGSGGGGCGGGGCGGGGCGG